MENTSYVLLSRQGALKRALDTVANNLANVNTTGYQSSKMLFEHYVERVEDPDLIGTARAKVFFTRDVAMVRDLSPGSLSQTGGQLDFGINGRGYFVIETPFGQQYTRAGRFSLDNEGRLTTMLGEFVLGDDDQPVSLPREAEIIQISGDGIILAGQAAGGGGAVPFEQVARLKLVSFENEQELIPVGGAKLRATPSARETTFAGNVEQGMLEASNVNAIQQLTQMIETQRAFDQFANFTQVEHDRMRRAYSALSGTRSRG